MDFTVDCRQITVLYRQMQQRDGGSRVLHVDLALAVANVHEPCQSHPQSQAAAPAIEQER